MMYEAYMNKVIFIDRDGVINKDLWGYVEKWEQFEFLPGVLESLKKLTQAGFSIIIISNQAGIADGLFSLEDLDEVNKNMLHEIEQHGARIAGTYYCPHSKTAECDCRKPKTGLFEQATHSLPEYEKEKTFYIGDKISDIKAGKNFGLKTIMVMTGYGEREKDLISDETQPDFMAADLPEAVQIVLKQKRSE